ncbi:uncharacterized protein PSANT_00012 [Moesziomyces antarcticus]|uniref:Uncharacterized protein n=2 Tax=Pseudozyma antarctica TaxID=84753 RepID=A0A5C3FG36_PSEA2|nr:uncharacterized protein PSANT_00012 [Moesziomyces antarcticus]
MQRTTSLAPWVAAALLLVSSIVQAQEADLCRDSGCQDCPVSIYGNQPYPACAVYDSGNSLTDNFDPPFNKQLSTWETYWNIQNFTPDCATIVRSPADVSEPGCGKVVGVFRNPVCAPIFVEATYMLSSCCGTAECNEATGVGARSTRRGTSEMFAALFKRQGGGGSALLLVGKDGRVIEPKQVGYPPEYRGERLDEATLRSNMLGLAASSVSIESRGSVTDHSDGNGENSSSNSNSVKRDLLRKRNCDSFEQLRTYTRSGDTRQISDVQEGPADVSSGGTQEVSTTTSFSSSVGDPFGIASVTVGFDFAEATSTTLEYTMSVPAGVSASIGWTPILQCVEGRMDRCDDEAGNGSVGEVCTPQLDANGNAIGERSLIYSS